MAEKWLPVRGFESVYQVSDHGNVRSIDRIEVNSDGRSRRLRGRIRKPIDDGRGYRAVRLYAAGRGTNYKVHALVLDAFVGPRPDGMEVRHLDGDRWNASLSNLAYGTHSENCQDILRHGNSWQKSRTHCPQGHEYSRENTYVLPSRPNARYCRACNRERRRVGRGKEA